MSELITSLSLSPQCRDLYRHLHAYRDKGITCAEGQAILSIPATAMPRRIKDMAEKGVKIRRERKRDRDGRLYVRYFLGA